MTGQGVTASARLIVDVDGTLTQDDISRPYSERLPRQDVIDRVNRLHNLGVKVVIYSARNMRTHEGNIGLINMHTLPILLDWLDRHGVRYDEIHMAKPWCGTEGFYVRANAIRPDQFLDMPMPELEKLIAACDVHPEVSCNER